MSSKNENRRQAPIEIQPDEFRKLGYRLVDQIAGFLTSLPEQPVSLDETPADLRKLLGNNSLPKQGTDVASLLDEAAELLFNHSTLSGHPRFWGYIIGAPSPIGALADLLAAAVNPNVGGWDISPIATEIEAQTIRWLAELISYPANCGGLLVSGGNMANFTPFIAARKAKTNWDVRKAGMVAGEGQRLRVYVSGETHTWVQKAADLFGLGTESIRWLPTDDELRMDINVLRKQIQEDVARGDLPFMVVGTAGTTAVGAIDPLPEIAAVCREHNLWFHVDGAYGAFAAMLPDAPPDLKGISEADSVALDPHKWLYAPLEAGCVLVRDSRSLIDAFSYHPDYYLLDDTTGKINYFEHSLQNSRGFRALKVWLAIRQVGRDGYRQMIGEDIRLAKELHHLAEAHPELEAFTHSLSVTTFRYVPSDLEAGQEAVETYLNQLNSEILDRMLSKGEAYLSNAIIKGTFALRLCIVNFRTSLEDIQALPFIVTRLGREVDEELRPSELQ